MSKCYPIDRDLQMRRNAKSSSQLRHNFAQDAIENMICVFFMRPARRHSPGRGFTIGNAAIGNKRLHDAFITMNSMARETFHIYTPLS
jgi:hypothetical protein